MDYAQFGPGLYGVCAASWYYFGEPPWNMTQYQADQLMGVLPDRIVSAGPPAAAWTSGLRRIRWR